MPERPTLSGQHQAANRETHQDNSGDVERLEELLGQRFDDRKGDLAPTEYGLEREANKRNLAFQSAARANAFTVLHRLWTWVFAVIYGVFLHPHLASHTELDGMVLLGVTVGIAVIFSVGMNMGLGTLWVRAAQKTYLRNGEEHRAKTIAYAISVVVLVFDFVIMYQLFATGAFGLALLEADGGVADEILRIVIAALFGVLTVMIAEAYGSAIGSRKALHQHVSERRDFHEKDSQAVTKLLQAYDARSNRKKLEMLASLALLLTFGAPPVQAQHDRVPAIIVMRDCTGSLADEVVTRDGDTRAEVLLDAAAGVASLAEDQRLLMVDFGDSNRQQLHFDEVVTRQSAPALRRVLGQMRTGCPTSASTDIKRAIESIESLLAIVPNRVVSILIFTDGDDTTQGHDQTAVYEALVELARAVNGRRVLPIVAVVGVREEFRLDYRRALNAFDTPVRHVSTLDEIPSALQTLRRAVDR